MSESKTVVRSGGIGLGGLLFAVLLALKLTVRPDLSWWIVTLPLWGVLAVLAALFVVIGAVVVAAEGFAKWRRRK